MIGLGTLLNVATILLGSALGVGLGHRMPQRTRDVVTDGLGLVTAMLGAIAAAAVLDPIISESVGSAGMLVVLASVLLGGIVGSLLGIEDRLEGAGDWLRRRLRSQSSQRAARIAPPGLVPGTAAAGRDTFVEGFVVASLVFCIGPLAVLGSLSDGLGLGIDQLALKSVMDGFVAIAFAATLGWGVAASAVAVGIYQGTLTVLGWALGSLLSGAQVGLMTATGGLLLVGIGLRLLRIRDVPVGDLMPALIFAPLLTAIIAGLR